MNVRAIVLGVTAVGGAGLFAGLGVFFFGSPDQAARVPASGLFAAAAVVLGGAIYLQASKPRTSSGQTITRVVVLLLIVFGIFCVIAIPAYTHVPPSRQAGPYLYWMALDWQKHVEEHARRTSSLVGSNLGLKSPVVEDTRFGRFEMSIDSHGTIKVRNTKFNLEALITPTLREGSVQWRCRGTPAEDMPPWCR
ncbi:MAG: hypothetical protein ACE5LB_15360 [Acidiferrobacterales bacterium]